MKPNFFNILHLKLHIANHTGLNKKADMRSSYHLLLDIKAICKNIF